MFAVARIAAVAGAVLFVTAVSAARAQVATPAAVRGVVVDSLRVQPLGGAFVLVEGTERGAYTDSAGRFFIGSLSAGEYRLTVVHPFFDTLGIAVVTPRMTFAPGDTATLVLATPSVPTLVRAKCGARAAPNDAAVIGLVVDSETDAPVPDVTVALSWIEIQAAVEIGLRRIPHRRVAASGPDGTFRICGVPADLAGDLVAIRAADTTGTVPVEFDNPLLSVRTLSLPSGPASAVVRGRVVDPSAAPIFGARVSLTGASTSALTDSSGQFSLQGQRPGTRTVLVRRVGFKPTEFAVNLSSQTPTEVNITLDRFVTVLDTVRVQARLDAALSRVGFAQRRHTGAGRFLTLEEIERQRASRLVDLLAGIPSLRTVMTSSGEMEIVGRTRLGEYNCVRYFVDGYRWPQDESPVGFVHPAEVGAVEVYSAETAPGEFQTLGEDCTVIVIWTRAKLGLP